MSLDMVNVKVQRFHVSSETGACCRVYGPCIVHSLHWMHCVDVRTKLVKVVLPLVAGRRRTTVAQCV